ncbi:MAG: DUF167 domain-containing protein [Desulfatibacillaceae bacterium]|nr:DUF167 domain-containing protein [Desulfatibacillaceae bacterium]
MALWMQKMADGLIFKVRVVPRASKTGAAGLFDDALKLRLAAPPVEGAANRECINFLSKALGVPKASIFIVHGQTGRTKTLRITVNPQLAAGIAKSLQALADGQAPGGG